MFYAFRGDQRVGETLYKRGLAAYQNDFQAIVMIEMHVQGRHDGGKMLVLKLCELLR